MHIFTQESGWQSGVRSCIMSRMSTHIVKELNVGIVGMPDMLNLEFRFSSHLCQLWLIRD